MGLFDTKEGWISWCCFSVSSSWTKDDEEKHLKPKKKKTAFISYLFVISKSPPKAPSHLHFFPFHNRKRYLFAFILVSLEKQTTNSFEEIKKPTVVHVCLLVGYMPQISLTVFIRTNSSKFWDWMFPIFMHC